MGASYLLLRYSGVDLGDNAELLVDFLKAAGINYYVIGFSAGAVCMVYIQTCKEVRSRRLLTRHECVVGGLAGSLVVTTLACSLLASTYPITQHPLLKNVTADTALDHFANIVIISAYLINLVPLFISTSWPVAVFYFVAAFVGTRLFILGETILA